MDTQSRKNRNNILIYAERNCSFLGVESRTENSVCAAGLYDEQNGNTTIHIESSEFMDLSGLVGTMAHELAHLRLMGERRVTGDEYDNELLTDLTAVFHGFGVFLGNSPRNWDSQYSIWPGTDLNRPEYMTLPMFAYVLAHTAWFRGQPKPDWYSYLSFDL